MAHYLGKDHQNLGIRDILADYFNLAGVGGYFELDFGLS